jgi:hypothetical protein
VTFGTLTRVTINLGWKYGRLLVAQNRRRARTHESPLIAAFVTFGRLPERAFADLPDRPEAYSGWYGDTHPMSNLPYGFAITLTENHRRTLTGTGL